MSRSIWKGPYIDNQVMKKSSSKKIKTWSRATIIHPDFLGKVFEVYNGKAFISFSITEEMIGHKLGEFSITKRNVVHKKK